MENLLTRQIVPLADSEMTKAGALRTLASTAFKKCFP
jgi:hypothetical protein